MSKDNGGSAFPIVGINGMKLDNSEGMTLRDYFAAQVIGHLVCAEVRQDMTTDDDASYAYKVADAMLAERAKC